EFDGLGKIKVPNDKYWGASTQRSNKHFDIGDFLVRPIVIKSIAMIKKTAAIVNAKNGDLDKMINKISLNHIMLETDAPYLTPTPYRGSRNESKYILDIAQKISNIYDIDLEKIAEVTTKNANKLFQL
ncbi:MAG: hypothetical protein HN564_01395, partial [Flavobacteriales bacterium]|nr:hypothetical protein [Flavobacteriales bacterium]